ncbi:hypothetical protein [Corynebacterium efficiens YS-314]|uniref:Uncharacterized protein n=1 Tax=Corynebacterium efficiens (strain DSM 44549 / YS-314 / AJ 12310 / JCM 11189 / NBRC 100395) TaxID=196164 RepID=Q8FUL6_COREF|nr:hypothetical protein [Corynebacterium efficiens YS-314]
MWLHADLKLLAEKFVIEKCRTRGTGHDRTQPFDATDVVWVHGRLPWTRAAIGGVVELHIPNVPGHLTVREFVISFLCRSERCPEARFLSFTNVSPHPLFLLVKF